MESVPIFVFILAVTRKMRVKMLKMTNLLDLRGGQKQVLRFAQDDKSS